MTNERELWRWILSVIVIVLMVLIVLTFYRMTAANDATLLLTAAAEPTLQTVVEMPTAVPSPTVEIAVDMIGAVRQPGVVYLSSPARIADAVNAAGGLAPDADREQINLAAHVTDGQQIRVPRVGETEASSTDQVAAEDEHGGGQLIDINVAQADELETLSGVGPVTAQAIIEYRSANGGFAQIEDLQNVKGIGPRTFDKLKDHITVSP